jgi:CO dehydrogenase/acetyl-CoA synthase beta subunit
MQTGMIIKDLREFLRRQAEHGKNLISYQVHPNLLRFFLNYGINVALDKNKDIILQEETILELGGINKSSFSMIFPISNPSLIKHGNISILGFEIQEIKEPSIDFGVCILIGIKSASEKTISSMEYLNFISDGIEGFSIRTVPRRFWCRISSEVVNKNFSFEYLGNAIMYLYKQKYKDLIDSIEIIFINSYSDSINEFIKITSEISSEKKQRWKDKIENWKKRIDCDYDWGCEICPYREECSYVKELLVTREEIGKSL